jgi:hypothetical protein
LDEAKEIYFDLHPHLDPKVSTLDRVFIRRVKKSISNAQTLKEIELIYEKEKAKI